MNRNSIVEALVLSIKPAGEHNRLATVLSRERGVFSATVYGGRKGKLRSSVSPYHSGTMWIYANELKQSIKVSDFDPIKYRSEIRDNLYKTYAAAFCAELIMQTYGIAANIVQKEHHSEEHGELWILANGFLDGLAVADENNSRIGTLRFLWRYIGLMGLQSDCSQCMHCESNMVSCYSVADNAFLCADCSHMHHQDDFSGTKFAVAGMPSFFYLSEESIEYLRAINTLQPKYVRTRSLTAKSVQELHDLLYFLIQHATQIKFRALDTGKGIL
ncbi:MAG: DNA repair protein RecO [Spirochaetales bacterium]